MHDDYIARIHRICDFFDTCAVHSHHSVRDARIIFATSGDAAVAEEEWHHASAEVIRAASWGQCHTHKDRTYIEAGDGAGTEALTLQKPREGCTVLNCHYSTRSSYSSTFCELTHCTSLRARHHQFLQYRTRIKSTPIFNSNSTIGSQFVLLLVSYHHNECTLFLLLLFIFMPSSARRLLVHHLHTFHLSPPPTPNTSFTHAHTTCTRSCCEAL